MREGAWSLARFAGDQALLFWWVEEGGVSPPSSAPFLNRDGRYFDEGLCGPLRKDAGSDSNCGLFKTPTLRNVATRRVFFHNGEVRSLEDAVRFYVERETRPERDGIHAGPTARGARALVTAVGGGLPRGVGRHLSG
jgi:cytochrome c peroxidase